MKERPNCLICGKRGKQIYSMSFKNENLIFFFLNYYGHRKLVRDFLSKIKNTNIYCLNVKIVNLFGKNIL